LVSCKAKAIALAPTTWSHIIHLRDGCETSDKTFGTLLWIDGFCGRRHKQAEIVRIREG
ncbi:unnamed protein product, partial [Scytosiphon promiscuus]